MNTEIKEQLLNLTIKDIVDLIKKDTVESEKKIVKYVGNRTLGKLDVFISSNSNYTGNKVYDYNIHVPEGILCYIEDMNKLTEFLKELNAVITKYQK